MSASPFFRRKLPLAARTPTQSRYGSTACRSRKKPRQQGAPRLSPEVLESRHLLAVTATLIGTDLTIDVDDSGSLNTAYLRLNGGNLEVANDALFTAPASFAQGSVASIKVVGDVGNEAFVLSSGTILSSLTLTDVEDVEFRNGARFQGSVSASLVSSTDISITNIATSSALSVTAPGRITQFGGLAYSTVFLNAVNTVEYVVSIGNDSGAGSLRAALTYLDDNTADVTASLVSFESIVSTVAPLSALPSIRKQVTLDGDNGLNLVRLDGSAASNVDGLTFALGSEDSVVRSLVVTNFNEAGIRIESSRVSVESSLIGLTEAEVAAANRIGILVSGAGVSACTIGLAGTGNVISGNTESGIRIENGAAATIQGNIIGLNSSGSAVVANGGDGVLVNGAGAVVIGGTNAGDGNTISGNGRNGIFDTGAISVLTVKSNLVGTDLSGIVDFGNALSGIVISDNAQAVITGNVVSGNERHGIEIAAGSSGNVVQDNKIGLDASLLVAIGNGLSGIAITGGSTLNTLGGTDAGNLVAGNGEHGIHLHATSSGTTVSGNTIGLKGDGSSGAGNTLAGVFVDSSSDNLIEGNTIAANFGHGIHVTGATAADNEIRGNRIGTSVDGTLGRGNFGAGILIEGVSGITIGGSSPLDANTVSANGLDGIIVAADSISGSANVVLRGNRVGTNIAGSAALGNGGVGIRIDGIGSDNALVVGNVVSGNAVDGIVVGNGAEKAQIASNLVGVNSTATGAVPNGGDGVSIVGGADHTVGGSSADRNVVSGNAGRGISVAAGATGVLVTANYVGTNGLGTAAVGNGSDGISVDDSPAVLVAGNVASGNGGSGIAVSGAAAIGTLIVGNSIGTNAAGLAAVPNAQEGIAVTDAVDTVIGGTAAGAANVISGNAGSGVLLVNASGTLIQANAVGLNAPRLAGLGNGGDGITVFACDATTIDAGNLIAFNGVGSSVAGHGIRIAQSSSTVIGNPATGQGGGNTIYRNQLDGIRIEDGSTGTIVTGNFVGTTSAGRVGLGNRGAGIAILDSTGNTVGGQLGSRTTDPILGNLVVGNADGVRIVDSVASDPADANTVLGNVIRSNRSTGIALSGSSGQVIGGVASTDANVVVLNGADGISVSNTLAGGGAGSGGNLIAGNSVGTDLTGAGKLGNTGDGIVLRDSVGNVVGGPGSGNTVTANRHGIRLVNAVAAALDDGNFVTANTVRTNLADGIRLEGSDFNTIGLLSPTGNADVSGGNAVWQNAGDGVAVLGGSRQNLVAGNRIGASASDAPLSNGFNGIILAASSENTVAANVVLANRARGIAVFGGSGNTIGGESAANGNVVRANSLGGVLLTNGATGTQVAGNRIDQNAGVGIDLFNATSNLIEAGNVVTRNASAGISLAAGSNGNTIRGTFVGTDADAVLGLGNLGQGIRVIQSAGNVIGEAGAGNTVLFNAGNGIEIINSTAGTAAAGDRVVANRVARNAMNGIVATGSRFVTIASNEVGGSASGEGNQGSGIALGIKTDLATITGNTVLGNGRHGIELGAATRSTIGGTTPGTGNVVGLSRHDGIFLGSGASGNTVVGNSVGSDAAGLEPLANGGDGIEVAASISNVVRGNLVAGNRARGIAVSNAAAPSLLAGNVLAGNTVRNNASGIVLAGSSGTTVGGTTTVGGVNVDANLVSGNTADGIAVTAQSKTSAIVGNLIETNGADGIRIASSTGTTVRLNEVRTNGGTGIRLATASGSAAAPGNQVLSNVIYANRGSGVLLNGSSFNAIGGVGAGNTIFGNGLDGITVEAASNSNDLVQNVIGIDASKVAAANGRDGIRVTGSFSTAIRSGNQIANNAGSGVRIVAAAAQAAAQGTRVTGNTLQANLAGGVVVDGGGAHTIGGTTAGTGNTITANGVSGVVLQMAPGTSKLPGVTVGQNTISANAGPGILVSGGGGHTLSTNRIVGNAGDGVAVGMSTSNTIVGNTIGGGAPSEANVNGILLGDGSVSNLLSGNTITANAADGIRMTGLRSTDNIIGVRVVGNPATGVANTVTNNAGAAVRIQQGVRNQVGTNAFFANLGGGVILQNGGNSAQPAPVLTGATRIVTGGLTQLRITGTLSGVPRQVMVVEFFANNPSDGSTVDRTGYQARTSIGRATVTLDATGRATFTTTLTANVAVGQYITAITTTASGTIGNSSQISTLAVPVTAAAGSPGTPPPPSSQPRAGAFTRW